MSDFILRRLADTGLATFGQLLNAEGKQIAVTLELPWRGNAQDNSCVPAGAYAAHRRFSPKHNAEVFELANVPDRGNIEIHIGNYSRDSLGCILLGTKFSVIDDENCITGSRQAFDAFMHGLRGVNAFTIDILDVPLPAA